MSQALSYPVKSVKTAEVRWNSLYKLGGSAALLQLGCTLAIIFVTAALGPRPTTAEEYFSLYNADRLEAFLRDDFLSLFMIALYLGSFPALYVALRGVNPTGAALAALCTFIGVGVGFSIHSGFSLIYLSDQYAASGTVAQRLQFLAAGEAVIAQNMWNSSGAYLTGILLQGAGILISVIMLKSRGFGKATALTGLLGNGFDLAQHLLHPFAPSLSSALILLAGPFYLLWFPLLARDLLRLGRAKSD